MFKILKKADILLFVLLLLLGVGLSVAGFVSGDSESSKRSVVISVAGEIYGTYDLSQNQEILIDEDGHFNKVIIKDGRVQITEANCHNLLCVKQGSISKVNQMIICLPHRLLVEITGEQEGGDVDVISG